MSNVLHDDSYECAWLSEDKKTITVDLRYPRSPDQPKRVVVGLDDVRAADDLTITYDFNRDGWVITREVVRDLGSYMEETGKFVEVARGRTRQS